MADYTFFRLEHAPCQPFLCGANRGKLEVDSMVGVANRCNTCNTTNKGIKLFGKHTIHMDSSTLTATTADNRGGIDQ